MSNINETSPPKGRAPDDSDDLVHWHRLVSEIGAGIAGPLTSALERVVSLTVSGRIDRQGLRALRSEIERARQVGIESQQMARLASGKLRQSHERVRLPEMLAGVLQHRARETQARGIEVRFPASQAVEVIIDAPLLFSLLNSTLDWALDCARSGIDLNIDVKTWPAHARLACHFAHRPVDPLDDGAAQAGEAPLLDSMHWRLLQQTAHALGLPIERVVDASATLLTLEFPHTVNETMAGVSMVEIDDGFAPSLNTKPLAGSHLLVVVQRRETRSQIRDALRNMGLIVDFVESVAQAVDFCREGLPHAIVVDSALCDERFATLREEIAAEAPLFVFIEIVEDSRAFEMSTVGEARTARIGRESIAQSLPAALLFELSRQI